MNIVARAENEGRQHMVSAAPAMTGVQLRHARRPESAQSAQRIVDDDDDDFASLMNPDKSQVHTDRATPPASPSWSTHHRESLSAAPSLADDVSTGSAAQHSDHYAHRDGDYARPGRDGDYARPDRDGDYARPEREFRSMEEEKQYYLGRISSFNTRGIPSHRRVNIDTPIDELKHEYERLKRQSNLITSVKFQRRILMAVVTGAEFVNKRFNPLNLKLDGWSESMMDSIEEYDSIFEQLHDKYSGTAEVAPEWQLMMMVLGSGFMFHLSNTLFRSVLPNVTDIAKQNPELMQNIANAMSSAMGKQGVRGDTVSEMGANLAAQALETAQSHPASDVPNQFDTPLQTVADPTVLRMPQATRPMDEEASEVSEDSALSGVSGLSDLRNVTARGGRKRRRNVAGEGRAVEINL